MKKVLDKRRLSGLEIKDALNVNMMLLWQNRQSRRDAAASYRHLLMYFVVEFGNAFVCPVFSKLR